MRNFSLVYLWKFFSSFCRSLAPLSIMKKKLEDKRCIFSPVLGFWDQTFFVIFTLLSVLSMYESRHRFKATCCDTLRLTRRRLVERSDVGAKWMRWKKSASWLKNQGLVEITTANKWQLWLLVLWNDIR